RIVECEDFLHANSDYLDELKLWAESDSESLEELVSKVGGVQLNKKTFGAGVNKIHSNSDDVMLSSGASGKKLNFTPMDPDEKRKASDKISKNREYAERRGKKKAKTSKVIIY
uniref:Uncharacterized protein n=1 Tax=Caenorhabditis japonica TaxID=281687 RepID=A0A8R1EDV8_CAEJA